MKNCWPSTSKPPPQSPNPLQAKKEIEVGDFNAKRGNFKGAAYRYREATHWDDGNATAFFKLGDASEHLKDYASARDAFEAYLKLVNDKKKTAEVQKRIAQYPKNAAEPKPGGPVSIDEAEKEDRAINGTVRGKGVITVLK